MASGFGGLGGSASYPQRYGPPRSTHVPTLGEQQTSIWDEYHAVNQGLQDQADQFWSNYSGALDARYSGSDLTPQQADAARSSLLATGAPGAFVFSHDPNGENIGDEYDEIRKNPNGVTFGQYAERINDLTRRYTENQLRQQQAYNSMSSWGQANAVPGPDYTNANFGQVSGQGATEIPNIPGVNNGWMGGLGNQTDPGNWVGAYGDDRSGIFGAPSSAQRWGL